MPPGDTLTPTCDNVDVETSKTSESVSSLVHRRTSCCRGYKTENKLAQPAGKWPPPRQHLLVVPNQIITLHYTMYESRVATWHRHDSLQERRHDSQTEEGGPGDAPETTAALRWSSFLLNQHCDSRCCNHFK